MTEPPSLTVARLTPLGRGAIATLAVEGAGAVTLVQRLFRPQGGQSLAATPNGRLVFGHFGPEPGEEVVVCVRSPGALEIHCHGGIAAVAFVEKTLVASGCRSTTWEDWLRGQHDDAIAAEAAIALAEALTERTAAILLDQHSGALRRSLVHVRQLLDRGDLHAAQGQLGELLRWSNLGLHLLHPWSVAVVGAANVGKSSLVNAILGYSRAIVDRTAGTTRDLVTATTAVGGWPIELCDTAGLRSSDDPVEQAGMDAARRRAATADLVVAVFDRSAAWTKADAELLARHPNAIVVHNKSDLAVRDRTDRPLGVLTSALRGDGIAELLDGMLSRLVPDAPEPGCAVPFMRRHVDAIERAHDAIDPGRATSAVEAVPWLTLLF